MKTRRKLISEVQWYYCMLHTGFWFHSPSEFISGDIIAMFATKKITKCIQIAFSVLFLSYRCDEIFNCIFTEFRKTNQKSLFWWLFFANDERLNFKLVSKFFSLVKTFSVPTKTLKSAENDPKTTRKWLENDRAYLRSELRFRFYQKSDSVLIFPSLY